MEEKNTDNDIISREARSEDFPQFKELEEKVWTDTDIDIISRDQFNAWIKVNSEGLRLAEKDGQICGYLYTQTCNFNPWDKNDNRNFNTITDFGYTIKTHNNAEMTIYIVSACSIFRGAARLLISEAMRKFNKSDKKYFTGTCRMPGLSSYARKRGFKHITEKRVTEYARRVYLTAQNKLSGKDKLYDPVLTNFSKYKGTQLCRVIKNFLKDKYSLNWAGVLVFENKKN